MVCIVLSWFLGAFCAVAFQCGSQFPYLWSSAANIASHCTKGVAVSLGLSIPDVITDGLILAVPLYWVSDFHSAVSQTSLHPADMETENVFLEETQCVWSFPFRGNVSNPGTDPGRFLRARSVAHTTLQHCSCKHHKTRRICYRIS